MYPYIALIADSVNVSEPASTYMYMCLFVSSTHQSPCKPKDECLRLYRSLSTHDTIGYTFPCSCSKGFHCPIAQLKDDPSLDERKAEGKDALGEYLFGYCRQLPGWHDRSGGGGHADAGDKTGS